MLNLPGLGALKKLKLPGSSRRPPGFLCINLWPDRVDVARVETAGRRRPEITLCHSYRKESNDAETLGRLRKELHLERYRCTTLLRSGDYQVMQVDAPNVPAQEARGAVRWRIKDMIDYPVETAAVDAWFIPQPQRAEGRPKQMLAVAARNEVIAATVKPFYEADIPLEVIDIPELAQRNLAHCLEMESRGLALLAIDEQSALLTFTSGGELYQHRRIDVSIESLSSAFPDQRAGLYDRLVLELQRSLDHFDRQFHHVAVAKVVVTPVPGAEDLGEHLAANLDPPVEVLYLSEIMDFPAVPDLHEQLRQAQCLQLIGASMRIEAAA
jgi:MSHA biogenesis protein MshI